MRVLRPLVTAGIVYQGIATKALGAKTGLAPMPQQATTEQRVVPASPTELPPTAPTSLRTELPTIANPH